MSGVQKSPVKRAHAKTNATIVWDSYVEEAAKPPFVIEFSGDRADLVIEEPSGGTMMDAQTELTLEEQLHMLCGECADDVIELLRASPGSAMLRFLKDVMAHFGLGDAQLGEASASTS